jgi:hypothetical protein
MSRKILNNVVMGIEGMKDAWRILGLLLRTIREEAEKRKETNPIHRGIHENQ